MVIMINGPIHHRNISLTWAIEKWPMSLILDCIDPEGSINIDLVLMMGNGDILKSQFNIIENRDRMSVWLGERADPSMRMSNMERQRLISRTPRYSHIFSEGMSDDRPIASQISMMTQCNPQITNLRCNFAQLLQRTIVRIIDDIDRQITGRLVSMLTEMLYETTPVDVNDVNGGTVIFHPFHFRDFPSREFRGNIVMGGENTPDRCGFHLPMGSDSGFLSTTTQVSRNENRLGYGWMIECSVMMGFYEDCGARVFRF